MKNEFTYTALATLLNAVEEISQNFFAGELDADMVAHLVQCAQRQEIRELARQLRQLADGKNP
jgi:predicted transcriptional regulator